MSQCKSIIMCLCCCSLLVFRVVYKTAVCVSIWCAFFFFSVFEITASEGEKYILHGGCVVAAKTKSMLCCHVCLDEPNEGDLVCSKRILFFFRHHRESKYTLHDSHMMGCMCINNIGKCSDMVGLNFSANVCL